MIDFSVSVVRNNSLEELHHFEEESGPFHNQTLDYPKIIYFEEKHFRRLVGREKIPKREELGEKSGCGHGLSTG